jgi:hypothetical protein
MGGDFASLVKGRTPDAVKVRIKSLQRKIRNTGQKRSPCAAGEGEHQPKRQKPLIDMNGERFDERFVYPLIDILSEVQPIDFKVDTHHDFNAQLGAWLAEAIFAVTPTKQEDGRQAAMPHTTKRGVCF